MNKFDELVGETKQIANVDLDPRDSAHAYLLKLLGYLRHAFLGQDRTHLLSLLELKAFAVALQGSSAAGRTETVEAVVDPDTLRPYLVVAQSTLALRLPGRSAVERTSTARFDYVWSIAKKKR